MEALSPDRILSSIDAIGPAPEEIDRYLAGEDLPLAEVIRALRRIFGTGEDSSIGATPWWEHAVAVAEGAATAAESTGRADPRRAYVAGLLHDIGHLIMINLAPAAFHRVLARQGDGLPFLALEREVCGLDHVRIGEQLLRRWALEDEFVDVIRAHHEPDGVASALVATVVLADVWAQLLGYGYDFPPGGISFRLEEAASAAGLIWGEQLDLLAQADFRVVERSAEIGIAVRPFLSTEAQPPKAVWVSVHGGEPTPLARVLLAHRGYEVVHVATTDNLEPRPCELLLIDSPWAEPGEVGDLVRAVVPSGTAHVALLADAGPRQPGRRRDPVTGICGIPRMFTAFDLRWLESCPSTVR